MQTCNDQCTQRTLLYQETAHVRKYRYLILQTTPMRHIKWRSIWRCPHTKYWFFCNNTYIFMAKLILHSQLMWSVCRYFGRRYSGLMHNYYPGVLGITAYETRRHFHFLSSDSKLMYGNESMCLSWYVFKMYNGYYRWFSLSCGWPIS